MPNLPAAKTNTEFLIYIPPGDQPATSGRVIISDHFHLVIDLLPLHTMLLPKLSSMDLENVLSIIMVFHTALFLINEVTTCKRSQ